MGLFCGSYNHLLKNVALETGRLKIRRPKQSYGEIRHNINPVSHVSSERKKRKKKRSVTEAIVKETLHEMDVGATLRPASSNGHYRFDCFDSLPFFIDHSSLVPSAITDVTSPLKLVLRTNRERAEDRTPIVLGSKPPLLTRIARTGLGTSLRPW